MQMIRWARGTSLLPAVECETYDVEGYAIDEMNQYAGFEGVSYIQSGAALSPEEDELTVFVINADWEAAQELTLDVRGFEGWHFLGHSCLSDPDPEARNSWENPGRLVPREVPETRFEKGLCAARLPSLSWNVFRFSRK